MEPGVLAAVIGGAFSFAAAVIAARAERHTRPNGRGRMPDLVELLVDRSEDVIRWQGHHDGTHEELEARLKEREGSDR